MRREGRGGWADDGVDVAFAADGGLKEIAATVKPGPEDDLGSLLARLHASLQELDAQILEMRIFGSVPTAGSAAARLPEIFGPVDWPVTWLQGADCGGGSMAGVQVHAVAGCAVTTLRHDGRPVGRIFEDEYARHCILGNVRSPEPARSREDQTRDTIEQLVDGLSAAGMDIHDLVRTWFFISDILGWYPAFNGVRSEIYAAQGVFDRFVPASTGIGAENGDGTALVASARAMRPKSGDARVRAVASPLQCPAMDYGSSFSRAAEVTVPGRRSLFVSGTASIDTSGATTHLGNVEGQIEQTLEVVGAILDARGMDFGDVVRGNAYFRHPGDAVRLSGAAVRHGLPLSRIVVSQNDVCRDDLLFELEIDALTPDGDGPTSG